MKPTGAISGRWMAPLLAFVVLAMAALVSYGPPADAQTVPKTGTSSTGSSQTGPDGLPKNVDKMTPAQIDALIAKIGDDQARRALLLRLKEAARKRAAAAGGSTTTLGRLEALAENVRRRLAEMFSGLQTAPSIAAKAVGQMTPRKVGTFVGILLLLGLFGTFVVGLFVEWAFRRWTRGFRRRIADPPSVEGSYSKAGRAFLLLILEVVGIALLAAVTYGLFFLFFAENIIGRLVVGTYVAAYILYRLVSAVSVLFLAPNRPALRIDGISDTAAVFLHRWVRILAAIVSFGFLTCLLLLKFGLKDAPHTLMEILVGLVTAIAIVVMVWQARSRVLAARQESDAPPAGVLATLLLNIWPAAATVYIAVIWLAWSNALIVAGYDASGVAFFALLLPLIILWLDRYFSKAFDRYAARKQAEAEAAVEREIVLGPEGEPIEETVSKPKTTAVALVRIYRRLTRGFLILVSIWLLLSLSGVDLFSSLENSVGTTIASVITDLILITLIAYVVWEVIRIMIDNKLSAEGVEDTVSEGEGEGGGAARSRAGTLLPLLRGFLAVTLIIITAMVVLSRLGVNIAPLIAGAGVLGLAIGFGAQTLVRDIVSGVFFLADDAFRLGEYVESGRLRGSVEKISIRSLRLRHHRGMIHTVPYGELRSITNYSRDWVIMKLEFRLPFGTNIEQVRKLIKKVGQEMQAHPDYGAAMLAPLKSQGVSRMDESGLIFRAKFSATPGEQFVIRREAYRMIQETLYENGIQFSNYQVSVQMPEDTTLSKEEQDAVNRAAAATAVSARSRQQAAGAGSGDDR